ncbi:MAG: NAD-dependent epimerase/dehydratase family protein [Planctomycetota bacterium]|nr:MAG: NAD-dependent epimerase/dehydratase family protein [Planctomycetota bacterium]REJ90319.1 MAG: NAD-dependent epimerase/dehydratase family protein [Planctomycetota bacterium]REK23131.1 MAG: NAD-dependent epimerase/dehydratase family protein [Planctomycetota bacterium]REK40940.1 MAG: NAD-dependent epimerase/dehydratase family protein [Planctomycetota bacterium]
MSLLVTGGAGFIGSHFIEYLLAETDRPLVALDSFNDYYDPQLKRANVAGFVDSPRVTLIEGDFCDQEAMHRLFAEHDVSAVVHFGAYAGVRPSVEHPHWYQEANVKGTLCLLEAARHHPVERFLSASSSTVYGAGAAVPFVEDAPLGTPLSPYGASKRAAELLGLTYHGLHDVPIVNLRFFSVYGPRLRPDLAMTIFTKAIHEGRPLPLFGDGSIRRDFTHISDICKGCHAALTVPEAVGENLNLGHNEPIEIRQLITMLADAVGKPAQIDYQAEKPGEMPITCADLTKSQRILGYQPQVAFAEGVPEFVDWYLSTL